MVGLAFILRIHKIDSPIIGMHSWRQADTAAIARNYYEYGYDFFYPQVDWGGNSLGYIEAEFPVYSYMVALLYKPFGVHEFLGRLLSIIFSLISIYFLYKFVTKLLNKEIALWSCFFFAILPPNIFYSRSFQPESALIMSLILGIYFFYQWLETEKTWYFALSAVFISLACLLKIPSFYVFLPILYLAWTKNGKKVFLQWSLWLYGVLVLVPVILWYSHAYRLYLMSGLTFGIWEYGTDKWGNWNLVFSLKFWNRILFQHLAEDYLVWIGFVLLIIGFFIRRKNKQEYLFDVWILALFVYVVIVAKGNYIHLYYQLPFMIPAVVFLGKVFARYFSWREHKKGRAWGLAISLLVMIALAAVRYQIYVKKENTQNSDEYKLAQIVKKKIEDGSLVIAVDFNDPTFFYLSHKKGWHAFPHQLKTSFVSQRKREGARYIVGIHKYFEGDSGLKKLQELFRLYKTIFDDNTYFILKIP